MPKITVKPDCGNSPKMEFLKNLNIAFASCDVEFLVESVTKDITWKVIGEEETTGLPDFKKRLNAMSQVEISELVLNQIISHGKNGAANGVMKLKNGQSYAFADFYEFTSAKGTQIKTITSYVLPVKTMNT